MKGDVVGLVGLALNSDVFDVVLGSMESPDPDSPLPTKIRGK